MNQAKRELPEDTDLASHSPSARGCNLWTYRGSPSHITQEGDHSLLSELACMASGAGGWPHSSWASHALISRALSTTDELVLFSRATASLRLTPVSSIPFTFRRMSPETEERDHKLYQCFLTPMNKRVKAMAKKLLPDEAVW